SALQALTQESNGSEPQNGDLVEVLLDLVKIMDNSEILQAAAPSDASFFKQMGGHKRTLLCATAELLWEEFKESHKVEDLDMSIEFEYKVLEQTPENHPDRAEWLGRLGVSHQYRFERLGCLEDLSKAVEFQEKAVLDAASDDPGRLGYLNNLGVSYKALFQRLGRLDDIQKSISYLEQAVFLTPDGHPEKPSRLNNLGGSFLALFEQSGRLQDANQATSCLQSALILTPNDHPLQITTSFRLGEISGSMFMRSQLPVHALDAMSFYKHATLITTGPPSQRLRSSRLWALLPRILGRPPLDAYTHCMTLIPQFIWLGASAHDRHEQLTRWVGILATEAATAAIELGHYDLAIEWLEQGRSVVWGQTLQLRTPYDELYAIHPEMAEELQCVSYHFECASRTLHAENASSGGGEPPHDTARKHRWLVQRREELLADARSLPGLEDFLRPPKASKIMTWVRDKTTVIVNVHRLRCDALVMQAGTQSITHVPLVGFSLQKAESARAELARYLLAHGIQRAVKRGDPKQKPSFTNILAMLWSDVAKPVLDHLGIIVRPTPEFNRVFQLTNSPVPAPRAG
ncbi:hypothetical protein FRC06_010858, partial [Ceratobasidium sp. 370]